MEANPAETTADHRDPDDMGSDVPDRAGSAIEPSAPAVSEPGTGRAAGSDPAGGPPGQGNGAGDDEALRERVLELLKNVDDPELGINIVDLGLVYGVEFDGDTVHITYTLTTMGCPIGPMIEAEMKKFVSSVDGIETVNAEMVLRPPWTPDMMSEEAKAALGYF